MRMYILYDERAILGPTSEASVLEACEDEADAREGQQGWAATLPTNDLNGVGEPETAGTA